MLFWKYKYASNLGSGCLEPNGDNKQVSLFGYHRGIHRSGSSFLNHFCNFAKPVGLYQGETL